MNTLLKTYRIGQWITFLRIRFKRLWQSHFVDTVDHGGQLHLFDKQIPFIIP